MKNIEPEQMKIILATDCGSTTTKARLFMRKGNEYRYVVSGEAPTTVETPYEDVTLGVRNAIKEVEELSGLKILNDLGVMSRSNEKDDGVDLYITTSSAGGGLQMMVLGCSKTITAESGERAALGAGAIVMDVICAADNVPIYEKIERLRFLRPDIILLTGGTDGGSIAPVVELAEIVKISDPKARFGDTYSLPIIFAGNMNAREHVDKLLKDEFAVKIVDNLRPQVDVEKSEGARDAIHDVFMEHVMSHAPGYGKLMKWADISIMPTPMAEGLMFQLLAKMRDANTIGVGLGGATTNIYSIYRPEIARTEIDYTERRFVRTVSANLGMSYSICNVLREAGVDNIKRWIPFKISNKELINILANKMIRPTTIPETIFELVIEHAVARESLRLGFAHHKELARGLRGVKKTATLSDIFDRQLGAETYIDLLHVDIIGGTGGLLSHAPRRIQSMITLIDGFQPEGITKLIQDSVFMMPHLGILSTVHQNASYEVFEKDCLVHLGTCISPRIKEDSEFEDGEELLMVELNASNDVSVKKNVGYGNIELVPLEVGKRASVTITPHRNCDIGSGYGEIVKSTLEGGEVGILIDCRGRPSYSYLPLDDEEEKIKTLNKWYSSLSLYPETNLDVRGR